eukprot:8253573-Pyramimonas_sp.AAC.2
MATGDWPSQVIASVVSTQLKRAPVSFKAYGYAVLRTAGYRPHETQVIGCGVPTDAVYRWQVATGAVLLRLRLAASITQQINEMTNK